MKEQDMSLSNELSQKRTNLSVERTAMSADRSLNSWVRTALSMISFGFTIYKFLQYLLDEIATTTIRHQSPRNLGLFLIGLGIVSIIFGSIQYLITMNSIREQYGYKHGKFPLILAALIGLLGLFLFITIALRVPVI